VHTPQPRQQQVKLAQAVQQGGVLLTRHLLGINSSQHSSQGRRLAAVGRRAALAGRAVCSTVRSRLAGFTLPAICAALPTEHRTGLN
jgi:hypothetical protein